MPAPAERINTRHMTKERVMRFCYICEKVGIGEVIKEVPSIDEKGHKRVMQITDTGVAIIRSATDREILTVYILNIGKLIWAFNGKDNIPKYLYKRVVKNERYAREQPNE